MSRCHHHCPSPLPTVNVKRFSQYNYDSSNAVYLHQSSHAANANTAFHEMKRNVRKQGLFEKRDHTQSFISIPNTMLETNLK